MTTAAPTINPDVTQAPPPAPVPGPRWGTLGMVMSAAAVLFSFVASPRTALFWYVFPLFALGITYVIQFRTQFPWPWRAAFAASAVAGAATVAFDLPFSGHFLWNVLFIGHAWRTGKRRNPWMVLLPASLVHLIAMKIAFQTRRDLAGALVAMAVATAMLVALERSDPASNDT